ncbi:conserved hypothetical protein [Vibrio vulnificus YJ016]|uniref:Peptidase M15A C-terminal domain-containing protein n=1 Tax=Vibrio vulnificus (strain YJ016) TaxID=196600 RepID=Q7MNT8_VIBVY|nr:D-Ala-D-Ala carboxypeptidase family metallohydrolase [Vibrio vulnificus]EIO3937944.1 DUF882 domain-containing protein [Vibrio vulnificus]EKZ9056229.1 DUF882 domain-containing protein [Vibrio vulnificus]MCU8393353.1 D-Ala-D-Ala carboxypeptidase family metallohydrolase [Vibrio vulnificus]MCU8538279.1 D-Ala-D-Ala carboxypeptidase family metallohydrolase [Vibrio vulnificus]MCU8544129.1 D-Ala-D-Ala carboxypeptidase family metallohydrolase [Vibrio vulnificus]
MTNITLSGSVGISGKNQRKDIMAVQEALNLVNSSNPVLKPLVVDGKLGIKPEKSKTVNAIIQFQKKYVHLQNPDGRIDVHGKTHVKLSSAILKLKAHQNSSILTAHFKWSEFSCNDKDNTPVPQDLRTNVKNLASQLEVIRSEIGKPIKITSAYRTPEYNRKIGGATNSLHVTGKAADLQVSGVKPKDLYEKIISLINNGKITQGGVGLYTSFVHYDIRGTSARWGK